MTIVEQHQDITLGNTTDDLLSAWTMLEIISKNTGFVVATDPNTAVEHKVMVILWPHTNPDDVLNTSYSIILEEQEDTVSFTIDGLAKSTPRIVYSSQDQVLDTWGNKAITVIEDILVTENLA